MTIRMKRHAGLLGLAVAAALSLSQNAAWASVDDYKFEAVSPSSRTTLTVRLVNPATGRPVTAAQVYVIQRQWQPMKSALRFIDRRIALTPNSDGTFTYESNDVQAGSTIQLGADVENGPDVQGSVRVTG
jgi:hypothetical protein